MVNPDTRNNTITKRSKALALVVILLGAAFTSGFVSAKNETTSTDDLAWTKNQLTEEYMRSITKASCMNKSLNYLKSCDSLSCLKTMAGVTGDCVTWAQGSNNSFCSNYREEYLDIYCSPMEDTPNCRFVLAIHHAICKLSMANKIDPLADNNFDPLKVKIKSHIFCFNR